MEKYFGFYVQSREGLPISKNLKLEVPIWLLKLDKKIMLDKDLAELCDVIMGNLNKAVKRNLKRFPEDFMFRLTEAELKNLIFQRGISSLH